MFYLKYTSIFKITLEIARYLLLKVKIEFDYVHQLLLLLLSRFSRVRLCDPIDGSPPGSSVLGILQARTLEWVAISISNA